MKPYIKVIPNSWTNIEDKGWGNGYVIIPKKHPFHGVDYDFMSGYVDVHCGLTYGKHEDNGHDGWCFGFDTLHSGDTPEKWPYEAVKEEAFRLMQQLIDLGNGYTRDQVNQELGEYNRQYRDYGE